MNKQLKKDLSSNLLLYPCPVILVTSKFGQTENVLTISWSGIASSHPEYVTIAVKQNRFSHHLIQESGQFGINIPTKEHIDKVDFCGSRSGKNIDKFDICKFTKFYGTQIQAPLIRECPVNLECQVQHHIPLGGHDLFIAKVEKKHINESIDTDAPHQELNPLVYFRPNYYALDFHELGYYGYTV